MDMEMGMDIHQVARLARLALSDEDAARYSDQLHAVLGYVAQLDELTDALVGVEPTSHAVPLETPMRADAVTAHLDRDAALANAPEHDGEAFIVPQVVGG